MAAVCVRRYRVGQWLLCVCITGCAVAAVCVRRYRVGQWLLCDAWQVDPD